MSYTTEANSSIPFEDKLINGAKNIGLRVMDNIFNDNSLGKSISKNIIVMPIIISDTVLLNAEKREEMLDRIYSGLQVRSIKHINLFFSQLERTSSIQDQSDIDAFIKNSNVFNFMNEQEQEIFINNLTEQIEYLNNVPDWDAVNEGHRRINSFIKHLSTNGVLNNCLNESLYAEGVSMPVEYNCDTNFGSTFKRELKKNPALMEEYSNFIAATTYLKPTLESDSYMTYIATRAPKEDMGKYALEAPKKKKIDSPKKYTGPGSVNPNIRGGDNKGLEKINSGAPIILDFNINVASKDSNNKVIPFTVGIKPILHVVPASEMIETLEEAIINNKILFRTVSFFKGEVSFLNLILGFDRKNPRLNTLLYKYLISKGRAGSHGANTKFDPTAGARKSIGDVHNGGYVPSSSRVKADEVESKFAREVGNMSLTSTFGYNRILTIVLDKDDINSMTGNDRYSNSPLNLNTYPKIMKFIDLVGIKSAVVVDQGKKEVMVADHGLKVEVLSLKAFGTKAKDDKSIEDLLSKALK